MEIQHSSKVESPVVQGYILEDAKQKEVAAEQQD